MSKDKPILLIHENNNDNIMVVREVYTTKSGLIAAGCYVTKGNFTLDSRISVIRDGVKVYPVNVAESTKIQSIKRFKDSITKAHTNLEYGIIVDGFDDIREGDIIQSESISVIL